MKRKISCVAVVSVLVGIGLFAAEGKPQAERKHKYRKRGLQDYLKGVWKGSGHVEKGMVAGRTFPWHLTLPKGDFSQAKNRIEGKPSRVQFIKRDARTGAALDGAVQSLTHGNHRPVSGLLRLGDIYLQKRGRRS